MLRPMGCVIPGNGVVEILQVTQKLSHLNKNMLILIVDENKKAGQDLDKIETASKSGTRQGVYTLPSEAYWKMITALGKEQVPVSQFTDRRSCQGASTFGRPAVRSLIRSRC